MGGYRHYTLVNIDHVISTEQQARRHKRLGLLEKRKLCFIFMYPFVPYSYLLITRENYT